jgi:predicted RNA-binding Zn-ribbon protein involved in translation (DUF1610 family)
MPNPTPDANFYVVSLTRGLGFCSSARRETVRADSRAVTYCPEDGKVVIGRVGGRR